MFQVFPRRCWTVSYVSDGCCYLTEGKIEEYVSGANISGGSTLFRTCIQICKGLYIHICRLYVLLHDISPKVFTRLAKVGVSVTHSTALRAVEKMGKNYDHLVAEWRELNSTHLEGNLQESAEPQTMAGYVLVGDNIDKRITPYEMRVDSQVQSLHYFHSYATKNRCEGIDLETIIPIGDIRNLPMSVFLPTQEECLAVRNNYVVLVSRIITDYLPAFSTFKKCVPKHIPHKYAAVMSEQFQMVRLWDVATCNLLSPALGIWHTGFHV